MTDFVIFFTKSEVALVKRLMNQMKFLEKEPLAVPVSVVIRLPQVWTHKADFTMSEKYIQAPARK